MKFSNLYILILAFFITICPLSFCEETPKEKVFYRDRDVAVIPFVNLTKNSQATKFYEDVVKIQMITCFGDIIPLTDIKPILRKNRIRIIGQVDSRSAKEIRKFSNVEYLITGSYDSFENETNKQSGISLRIVDIETMSIVWSKSIYYNELDYIPLFNLKEKEDFLYFIKREMWKEHRVLSLDYLDSLKSLLPSKIRTAVVQFNNASEYHRAGEIVSNQVISELLNQGYNVIEPGIINELMISNHVNYRGEVDLNIIEKLYTDFNIELILTGTVEEFRATPPSATSLTPKVEMNIRFIDPITKQMIDMYNKRIDGADSETFLRLGKIKSVEKISQKAIHSILDNFKKDNKNVFSKK